MPIKVTSDIRPLRWLAGIAAACLIAYVAGTANATAGPSSGTPTPTVAACTSR